MSDHSGRENRTVADEHTAQRADENQRHERRSIWEADAKEAARIDAKARALRRQIEATKQNGRDDNGERLRELGREHHRAKGTAGGAT